jgi:hypothetical protein
MKRLFKEEIVKVPIEKRCIQTKKGEWNLPLEDCYFGVPQSDFFGWTALHEIPAELKGVHFYLGADAENLINKFVNSEYAQQVERLSIGNSSFNLGSGLNYENITKILQMGTFPNLKIFQLGVWELYSNSHCLLGKIGNLSQLLKKMPKLENLMLYGNFKLDSPIELPELQNLSIELDDYETGVNGGPIENSTLKNLLESSFPNLKEAYIDLECEKNEQNYRIPDLLISGSSWPNIQKMEFTGGYAFGEKEKLLSSEFIHRNKIKVLFDDPE